MLAENSLQRLPSTLGRLHSLKVLVLDSNQLSILPDEGNYLQKPLTDTVIEIS
jgi:Leucine-rich repeat (LRR) protein